MINKVILLGNLGRDPEHTGKVCKFSMATTSRKKDGDDWVDFTEWHRVVCFGKMADNAMKYMSKGSQCYVEGKMRTNKWEDKDGNTRYTTEVIADIIKFLGKAPESSRQMDTFITNKLTKRDTVDEDEIPF
jgi:single-strand DNA-binding protein